MVIHDLEPEEAEKLNFPVKENMIINKKENIHNCIGCFGCWVKTPGKCVIKDNYSNMGELLSKRDELVIISECFYGGYSPFIKNILDRSISYLLPDFLIRKGEMHHKSRYKNKLKLKVYFYGDNITDLEKKTAIKLVNANSDNLNAKVGLIMFLSKDKLMKEGF
ncbi:hypothetical protein SAMN04487886_100639 [Clostridium sp. DSM 8431]|uniref:flavodoxin family protein n=1 Tax=Clostridium sp. DSM 8431 TaxID=1761781 RepID=UPI0008ED3768|nr:hypothetical protein SAMN04487886_100639 [Clostridium sp. DSM 8431]